LDDLRRLTAFAFEDTTLFSSSVRDNVLLGVDPELPDAVQEEIAWEALHAADADFVVDLIHGIETRIGEEGFSLSGGQRQRIALARAIAARPSLLLLDDPLSALDTKTEERVIDQLKMVLDNTTTFIIAHRSSTVSLADRVALLDHGKITAVGTHQELLRSSPRYRYIMATNTAGSHEANLGAAQEERAAVPRAIPKGPRKNVEHLFDCWAVYSNRISGSSLDSRPSWCWHS